MTPLRIGSGAGYSGDRIPPAADLARRGQLDWLIFECLAERTIALAQLEKQRHPDLGFDPLLRERIRAVLPDCMAQGVRIITNMGAAHPRAAALAARQVAAELGLHPKIALLSGDDVLATLLQRDPERMLIDRQLPLSALGDRVVSANAYLGAEHLLPAIDAGADLIITGRVADPALFLAPVWHHFGWRANDWNRLGQGVVLGHLLECAAQVSGGYFADPGVKDVPDLAHLGFPLAEVQADGSAIFTKLPGTGGCVTLATCTEQLLYELEDPSRYLQPDVVADFTAVALELVGPDRVRVSQGRGQPRPDQLKVTVGYRDGYIADGQMSYAGLGAVARGQLALDVVRVRLAEAGLGHLETRFDLIGCNAILAGASSPGEAPEVRLRVSARCDTPEQAKQVTREVEALYLNGPAGGGGATQSVREVIAADAVLIPRDWVQPRVEVLS
ncbi:MAG: DUF1446 domain-containing protein [Alphaproteobacteria bacterium]|nr:DUF1446 domain-containing protein [Alphaproteobacteria bacterium]